MCCLVARRGEKRAERDNRVIHYKGTVVYMLSIIVIVNRSFSPLELERQGIFILFIFFFSKEKEEGMTRCIFLYLWENFPE